jgi:hypothetical protein
MDFSTTDSPSLLPVLTVRVEFNEAGELTVVQREAESGGMQHSKNPPIGLCTPLIKPCKLWIPNIFDRNTPGVIIEAPLCYVAEPIEEARDDIIGIGPEEFERIQLLIWVMLGNAVVLKNDTAYWECRDKWKNLMRKKSLSDWRDDGETSSSGKRRRISFNHEIFVKLIAPKEGEDFDIDDSEKEKCKGYKNLSDPLLSEEDYKEYWTTSPFPHDFGSPRPFYDTTKMHSQGWCLCKKPPMQRPGRAISCRKCLNMELRKFARKSTPEEFHEQYLKNISD